MKFHTGVSAIAVFGVLGAATWSCSSTTAEGCLCGGGLRAAVVAVVDTQGVAVTDLALTITRVATEENIEFIQSEATEGFYIIMSDDFVGTLETTGEVIRVEGRKGTASFLQDFVFGTDECRCHITRVSGPDTGPTITGDPSCIDVDCIDVDVDCIDVDIT